MTKLIHRNIIQPIIINKVQSGCRLDKILSQLLPNYSRSKIKKWIIKKKVKINNCVITMPDKKVFEGELVKIDDIFECSECVIAENIPLNIVYEDEFIIIINKSANFVVHPGSGNPSGTVLNALLYHYPDNSIVPRAGIIHRLDKDTTGLMLVAKNIDIQVKLINLMQSRKIIREYDGIVYGSIMSNGMVNKPITRHFVNRTCMYVHASGKLAVTHYKVVENFFNYTRVKLRLETGRTHQIRVHMAYIKHPLVGDKKYGKSKHLLYLREKYKKLSNNCSAFWSFDRQALHASMLEFVHPITGVSMAWQIPLPLDMLDLLNILRLDI